MRVQAIQKFTYDKIDRNIGDVLDIPDDHATLLNLHGRTKAVEEQPPQPAPKYQTTAIQPDDDAERDSRRKRKYTRRDMRPQE